MGIYKVLEQIKNVLGEDTHIKLGLAIVLAGTVWWAASLSSKVDTILTNQAEALAQIKFNAGAVEDIEHRIDIINRTGTEVTAALKLKLEELERRVGIVEMSLP